MDTLHARSFTHWAGNELKEDAVSSRLLVSKSPGFVQQTRDTYDEPQKPNLSHLVYPCER